MPAFCPLCATDHRTESGHLDDGTRYSVCFDPSHGADGFVWQPSDPDRQATARNDGLGAELGVWDKLLACFNPDEDFVAYGVIEDRFVDRNPDAGQTLLHRYGHRWKDPAHPAAQYSMSAYLALRLRELEKEGLLDLEWGPAEGEWAYNEVISYWRLRSGDRQ